MDLSDEDLIDLYLVLRDRRAKRKVNFDDADIVDKLHKIKFTWSSWLFLMCSFGLGKIVVVIILIALGYFIGKTT